MKFLGVKGTNDPSQTTPWGFSPQSWSHFSLTSHGMERRRPTWRAEGECLCALGMQGSARLSSVFANYFPL